MSRATEVSRPVALALAALVTLSALAVPVAAALNYDAGAAPQGYITSDVTVSSHQVGWDALQYEGDSGDIETLPATVNETGTDNPYSYAPTGLNFSDARAFPHSKDDISAVGDTGEWSTTTGISVSDVETAPGVDAVEFATNGSFTTNDQATATFDNFSVTSDVSKRFLQVGLTVDTLDTDAVLEVRAVDADGDYVNASIDTARSSGEDFIANSTGEGFVYQRQVGKMTVRGNGDGSMGEIQKVEIVAMDADSNVDVMLLNVEKMSKYDFGEERVDTDGDDELETETIHESKTAGDIAVHDLSTLGDTFDDATINDLTFSADFRLADLPEDDSDVEFSAAESYPAFEHTLEAHYRIQLPDAYDLTYSNAVLRDKVSVPSGRYETVEYAEGVGDTSFADVSSWSSVKSSYSSEGANVTVDDTIQPGQEIALHYVYPVTADEKAALQATGAVGGPIGGAGGLGDLPVIGGVVAALGGLWAWVTGRLPI